MASAAVAPPLDLLALDLRAKLTAYRNALAWHQAAPLSGCEDDERRLRDARAELGRSAVALAQWCGVEVPPTEEPESHGVRRARVADEIASDQRRRERELDRAATCLQCGGTGRRPGFDLDPCIPCGGGGRL